MPIHLLYRIIGSVLLFMFSIVLLLFTILNATPVFSNVLYQVERGAWQKATLPLSTPTKGKSVRLRFDITLSSPRPTYFTLIPDDCLLSLRINGMSYDGTSLPFCDTSGADFSLKRFLYARHNTVFAELRDDGGDLKFEMRPLVLRDPIFLLPKLLVLFSGILTLLYSCVTVRFFLRKYHLLSPHSA